MASSDFWHDLAIEFRAFPDGAAFRGDWDYTANSGRPYQWRFAGANPSTHTRFEALARRAAYDMPSPEYSDLLLSWLEAIRTNSRQSGMTGTYCETNADGSDGPLHLIGSLHNLCEESAIYCDQLESDARQREFEEKQRSDPRNWSQVRQNFEAFKSIKKIVSGPHETIPEAVVRTAIAQQYGILPDEVTWKQIRMAVADLLRDYPAITLVPTELAPSQRVYEDTPSAVPVKESTPSSISKEPANLSLPEETIAAQLERLRDECRWTIPQLAEGVGIDSRTVDRHLAGDVKESRYGNVASLPLLH